MRQAPRAFQHHMHRFFAGRQRPWWWGALLALSVFVVFWTQPGPGGPDRRSFGVGAILAGVVYLTVTRQARLAHVAEQRANEIATLNAELEQRVADRTRELATLLDISREVTSTLQLGPLVGLVLDALGTVVAYSSAAVLVGRDEAAPADDLIVVDARGSFPTVAGQPGARLAEWAAVREALRRRAPVVIGDVQDDTPLARAYREGIAEARSHAVPSLRCWMGAPLIAGEQVIGLLRLGHHDPHSYTEQHVRLVMTIANQAAVAITNARLYARAREVAALEERQRLARDLHDSVSQVLYSSWEGSAGWMAPSCAPASTRCWSRRG